MLTPSVLILSTTWRTLSGWLRAFSSRLARPKSTSIRSVPAEIRVARVSTRTLGPEAEGTGTSTRVVSPVSRRWRSCFTEEFEAMNDRYDRLAKGPAGAIGDDGLAGNPLAVVRRDPARDRSLPGRLNVAAAHVEHRRRVHVGRAGSSSTDSPPGARVERSVLDPHLPGARRGRCGGRARALGDEHAVTRLHPTPPSEVGLGPEVPEEAGPSHARLPPVEEGPVVDRGASEPVAPRRRRVVGVRPGSRPPPRPSMRTSRWRGSR